MKTVIAAAFVFLTLFSVSCGSSEKKGSDALCEAAEKYETYEKYVSVVYPAKNSFDKDEIEVYAKVKTPDGTEKKIAAFFYQGFDRVLKNGAEVLTKSGEPSWMLRFTPDKAGRYEFSFFVKTPDAETPAGQNCVEVKNGGTQKKGFARASKKDRRYVEFDDGSSFFAIGENMGWYDSRGTAAYEDWMKKLADNGGNYIRVWMSSWAFGLEWTNTENGAATSELGDYSRRLDRAFQLDYLFSFAEKYGVYVMLCVVNHGAFSINNNSEWDANPYNAKNGGPLDSPSKFFTDEQAKKLTKRKLDYILARWGYSANLLAWELFNEVDLTDKPKAEPIAAWHEEMAAHIKAADPYNHMITTSNSGFIASLIGLDDALFSLENIDFSQFHIYGYEGFDPDFTSVIPNTVEDFVSRFGKPCLASELGVDYRGPSETKARDPYNIAFHDIIWSGLTAGSFGVGMHWWWDNIIDPDNLYYHFAPIAKIVDGIKFHESGFNKINAAASADGGAEPSVFALCGENVCLGWVKNAKNLWTNREDDSQTKAEITGTQIELTGVAEGKWNVRLINAYDASVVQCAPINVGSGGTAKFAIPVFVQDAAFRMEKGI